RSSLSGDLTSSTRGDQSAVALKAGYPWKGESPLAIDPYFRVEHIEAKIDGFGESGGGDAIAVNDVKVKSTVSTLGAKLRYTVDTAQGEVRAHLRFEYHKQSQDNSDPVVARLVAAPELTQSTVLPQQDQRYGNVSLGASGIYDKHWDWYLNWEHLFGMEDVK